MTRHPDGWGHRATRRPRVAVLLAVTAVACVGGCAGRERGAGEARRALGGVLVAARSRAEDLRRAFEENAAQARDQLDEARAATEAAVRERLDGPRAALRRARDQADRLRAETERVRRRARQALREGAEILRQAARDGGDAAESWARLIQERMIRLEESLDALQRSDREHAAS